VLTRGSAASRSSARPRRAPGRLTAAVGLALVAVRDRARLATRRIETLGRAETRAWETMAQRIVEMLRTRRTIRAFGREAGETARFAASSDGERWVFERLQRMQALVAPASELLVASLMLAVLWVRADVPGELPVVLTFLALLYRLQPQVQQLDGARVSLAAAAAPTGAVMALLALPEPARAGTRVVEHVTGEIASTASPYARSGPRVGGAPSAAGRHDDGALGPRAPATIRRSCSASRPRA
jgi:ABC-type multidrug transport system fused ATPase/permease subunit